MDVRLRIAVASDELNVAAFCREHGVSRQTFYVWRRRYLADGLGTDPGISSSLSMVRRREFAAAAGQRGCRTRYLRIADDGSIGPHLQWCARTDVVTSSQSVDRLDVCRAEALERDPDPINIVGRRSKWLR
jgi:hypothetical protein